MLIWITDFWSIDSKETATALSYDDLSMSSVKTPYSDENLDHPPLNSRSCLATHQPELLTPHVYIYPSDFKMPDSERGH